MLDNIKSVFILNKLFNNIRNIKKLRIIKHNKKMLNRLNIKKEEFMKYKSLKEFNDKFELDIIDINIKELNLRNKYIYIKNDELKYLNIFGDLERLNLELNSISDIELLKNMKFKELKELELGYNRISDISALKKFNFKKLEILNLVGNQISDNIKGLENANFNKLKVLNIGNNNISDISVLEKVNFKILEDLCLYSNPIKNLNILQNVKFEELKKLDLIFIKSNFNI